MPKRRKDKIRKKMKDKIRKVFTEEEVLKIIENNIPNSIDVYSHGCCVGLLDIKKKVKEAVLNAKPENNIWECPYCKEDIKIVNDGDRITCGNHPVSVYAVKNAKGVQNE